ncbi:hypothetical protein [Fluviispira multicolorata]|uniref:Lipoprotein n=1 Tax=Fluviispira multicolorata TaxID=2654512 RepID=A0A833JEU6_9BACT|nr:hypothetical protein [Fluviispira multicolorata]KAB8030659.1 hypothetical protein GCL57_06705 [Fluviispira multicolorata]
MNTRLIFLINIFFIFSIVGCGKSTIGKNNEEIQLSDTYSMKLSSSSFAGGSFTAKADIKCEDYNKSEELSVKETHFYIPNFQTCHIYIQEIKFAAKSNEQAFLPLENKEIIILAFQAAGDSHNILLNNSINKYIYKEKNTSLAILVQPQVFGKEVIFNLVKSSTFDIPVQNEPEIKIKSKFVVYDNENIKELFNFHLRKLPLSGTSYRYTLYFRKSTEGDTLFRSNCKILTSDTPRRNGDDIDKFYKQTHPRSHDIVEKAFLKSTELCISKIPSNTLGNWDTLFGKDVYFIFKTDKNSFTSYNTVRFSNN